MEWASVRQIVASWSVKGKFLYYPNADDYSSSVHAVVKNSEVSLELVDEDDVSKDEIMALTTALNTVLDDVFIKKFFPYIQGLPFKHLYFHCSGIKSLYQWITQEKGYFVFQWMYGYDGATTNDCFDIEWLWKAQENPKFAWYRFHNLISTAMKDYTADLILEAREQSNSATKQNVEKTSKKEKKKERKKKNKNREEL